MAKIEQGEIGPEDAPLSAIDESLEALCIVSVRDSFYEFFDEEFDLRRNEISTKLDLFVEALQMATGMAPSRVIMKNVLKRFHAKLGIEFDSKNFDKRSFQAWVKSAVGNE